MKQITILLLATVMLVGGGISARFEPSNYAKGLSIATGEEQSPVQHPDPVEQFTADARLVKMDFFFSEVKNPAGENRELSVAFHSVTMLDSTGHSLGVINFGEEQGYELQGDGWFIGDIAGDGGSVQWAGGVGKQASMHLIIPEKTKGLILKIKSIVDGLWIDVTINKELKTTLFVDRHWHQGYVPIDKIIYEPIANTGPEWSEDLYFPFFPPTDTVYVFPVPTELETFEATSPTWRINESYQSMMSLTIVGMQGIINRTTPRVYLDYQNQLSDASRFWVPYLNEHIEVIDLDLDYLSTINFLLQRYRDRFLGAVIYDPEIPETINLATMIAGLEDRMILAPEQVMLPGIPDFESIVDLRQLVIEQDWDNSVESKISMYQWVYDNLWQNLEHRIIGVISPGPPASGEYRPGHFNPLGLAQRDYYIALRTTALYLDPGDPQQAELYGKFLNDAPSPIPVTGVTPLETTSVPFIARYGDWNATLSYPQGSLSAFNLTVFSAVRPELKVYEPQINNNRILATLDTHPVAMVFSSDGDNLSLQMDRGFHGGPDWVWEKVQGNRFGWTMNPVLGNLAPVIWNYYVDSRDEVEFVCGISGAGATLIDYMSDSQFKAYIDKTALYLNQTGLRTIMVHLDKINRWTKEMASGYQEGLKDTDYLGAVSGPNVPWGFNLDYADSPTPSSHIAYSLEPSSMDEILDDIFSRNTDETIFDFSSYTDHKGEVISDPEAGTGQAVLFSDDPLEFREVMSGPIINLPPGKYTATFRFKVSNNQISQDFVYINIGHMKFKGINVTVDGWEEFARIDLAPAEFEHPNQYQMIHIPFTLNQFTTYLEVIMGHKGIADLTADYFSITRDDPEGFPVFAVLFIPTLSAERLTEVPEQFTIKFESAGGILLTPDEFMAALNPEYMIKFASSILGNENAALIEAQQQYEGRDYYGSLLTVRNALSQYLEQLPKVYLPVVRR